MIPLSTSILTNFHFDKFTNQLYIHISAYGLQFISFLLVVYYLIKYLIFITYTMKKDKNIKKQIKQINKCILIITPISIFLCLTCIILDFIHLLFAFIYPEIYKCGIRDKNFIFIRASADFSQFWGYIIFWSCMVYRLFISFNNTPFMLKVFSKIILIILIILDVCVLTIFNILQLLTLDSSYDSIFFSVYSFISLILNCLIMYFFSYKLNKLVSIDLSLKQKEWIKHVSNVVSENTREDSQSESHSRSKRLTIEQMNTMDETLEDNNLKESQINVINLITKYNILFSLQLISYMIAYIYRIILSFMYNKIEKIQLLWVINYILRDIMCLFMVIAIYYAFGFVKNDYKKHFKWIHPCLHECCKKCSKQKLKKRLIKHATVNSLRVKVKHKQSTSGKTNNFELTTINAISPTIDD